LSSWVLMTPVLTQLRNPRTQPKWFLGFFLALKTYICWVDILLHKTATVCENKKKLADTPNCQRKVECRAQIFVSRIRYCEVIIVRHKSHWCQWRWGCCIVNQSKWVLIVTNDFNWEPKSPTDTLGQCSTSRKFAGSIPDWLIEYFTDLNLLTALWSRARRRNEYQGYLLAVKWGQYVGLKTFMRQLFRNSGSLNLLEP
jgi:hypothetical protein